MPPRKSWTKLNFNGTSRRSPRLARVGSVMKVHTRNSRMCFIVSLMMEEIINQGEREVVGSIDVAQKLGTNHLVSVSVRD